MRIATGSRTGGVIAAVGLTLEKNIKTVEGLGAAEAEPPVIQGPPGSVLINLLKDNEALGNRKLVGCLHNSFTR